ncbi:hypothetical protein Hanom_Chr03g00229081 [Helianthus anomalus]
MNHLHYRHEHYNHQQHQKINKNILCLRHSVLERFQQKIESCEALTEKNSSEGRHCRRQPPQSSSIVKNSTTA